VKLRTLTNSQWNNAGWGSASMRSALSTSQPEVFAHRPSVGRFLWLASSDDPGDDKPRRRPSTPNPTEREELPYKVEIWDDAGAAVEQVVAVTANASIGYAAYYAATREFPDRRITLRHKNSVVARWNAAKH
jgi:hypothetical protein